MKSDDKPKLPGWLAKKYGSKPAGVPHGSGSVSGTVSGHNAAQSSNHGQVEAKAAHGKKLSLVQLPKLNNPSKN